MGVDGVALSFVRRAEDIIGLKRLLRRAQRPPAVVAKIERREAIENLDSILDVADGVMIARGDLGVEYPAERVPILQKRIIERANLHEVLVITATQMLESMVYAARPTRAEASDVANAIFDGTDAVMLSAETAVGIKPDRAVQTMARIAAEADEFAAGHSGAAALHRRHRAHVPDPRAGPHRVPGRARDPRPRARHLYPYRLFGAAGQQVAAQRADSGADPAGVHLPPAEPRMGRDAGPGAALADRGGDDRGGSAAPTGKEDAPPR